MTPLALMLVAVLILSAILIIIPTLQSGGFDRLARSYYVAYSLAVCATLAAAVGYFVGFDSQTNPRLPLANQRRFAHVGYYAEPGGKFAFAGKARAQEFEHEALAEDEFITLEPVWVDGAAHNWRLKYNVAARPLRVGGQCVNMPEEWWLNPGDELIVYDKRRGEERFFLVRWDAGRTWRGIANTYSYSQGTKRGGQLIYDVDAQGKDVRDIPFSAQVLREGRRLSFMLAHPLPSFEGLQLRGGEWADIFEGIMWVRERMGDRESRMGGLISKSLFADAAIEVFKNETRLSPPPVESERIVSADDTLFYGLGFDNSLNLRLQNQPAYDPARVEVRFVDPKTWPLPGAGEPPPEAGQADVFIITSAKDYIPLNSYYINLGEARHAFYARAKLNPELDSLTVNDGKAESVHRLHEVFRLGDLHRGALLVLTPVEPSIRHAGWWAVLFLGIAALLFYLDALSGAPARWRLNLAWTLIWSTTLTLLVVRFILAYRLSLLPPDDATPDELANVFHRGFRISFYALLMFPAALVGIRFLARSSALADFLERFKASARRGVRRKRAKAPGGSLLTSGGGARRVKFKQAAKQFWRRDRMLLLIALLPVLWAGLGKAFGQTEAIFGASLRLNLLTHVILVVLIAITAERSVEQDKLAYKLGAAASLLLTLAVLIFWIGDRGFLIYGLAFGLYLSALFLWHKRRTYFRYIIPVLVVAVLAITPLLGFIWSQNLQGTYLGDTTNFRIASYTETEDAILLARSDDANASVDRFLSNIQQHWQMLLYAARGAREPSGFGKAPLTHKAMTYPTSMADCVFSMYVLSEHGMLAGVSLLLIYIALCFVVMYGSWFLPANSAHRVLPLITIGAFFACNALYMASANISLLPFTGQNIPLLSLYSTTDLLQNWLLVALAVWLLTSGLPTATSTILKDQPAVRELGKAFLIVILLWGVLFVIVLKSMTSGQKYEKYTRRFDLRSDVLEEIKKNVDPQMNRKWTLVEKEMVPQNYATVSEIERRYARQFNERDEVQKYDRDRGLYYIQRISNSQNVLRVNDRYFRMESPFDRRRGLWRGLILSRTDQAESLVSVLGKPLKVSLKEEGQTQSISINEAESGDDARSILVEGCGRDVIQVELKRHEGKLLLGHKRGDWNVYVNGLAIYEDHELKEHDIVVVEKGDACRYNMMYLGSRPAALAYVKWQNGMEQRIILESSASSLVYVVGNAADRARDNGQELPDKLILTLDAPLHRSLQQEVEGYARQDPHYRENDPFNTDSLAISVLDAFSGEVLALPSWPLVDPSEPKYAKAVVTPARKAELLTNRNLTNHPVGSTVKPLIFATLASQFWPEEIADLSIYNRASRVSGEAHFHTSIGGIPISEWNCGNHQLLMDSKQFLYSSLNFYEATLGTLGLLFDKSDLFGKALEKRASEADVVYKGQNYALDMRRASLALSTATSGSRPSTDMDKTLLFQGLPQLFNVRITNAPGTVSEDECTQFLPTLCGGKAAIQNNEYVDNVLPQPVVFAPNSFQHFDTNTLRFFIGADQCLWNNVRMSESAARLVTGRRVVASLERAADSSATSGELPAPLNDANWRSRHLIDPLEQTGSIGTAQYINVEAPPGFRILYKTGTIDEGNRGRESENLMIVLGQWDKRHGEFVQGKTLACFLYMEESKENKKADTMKKFILAKPLVKRLLEYIQRGE